jgi:Cu+-exporting ATPase
LLVFRSLNMFTLIGLGVTVAFVYSLVTTLVSSIFSDSFRGADGLVGDCGVSPCRWAAS